MDFWNSVYYFYIIWYMFCGKQDENLVVSHESPLFPIRKVHEPCKNFFQGLMQAAFFQDVEEVEENRQGAQKNHFIELAAPCSFKRTYISQAKMRS